MAAHEFSIKEAIFFGWITFKSNWKYITLSLLTILILRLILSSAINSIFESLHMPAITAILNWIIDSFIIMSAIIIALKFVDRKKPRYRDLYLHYSLFPNYILGSVLVSLIMFIPLMIINIGNYLNIPQVGFTGFILLIFPGVYLNLKYQFTTFLIIDKKMHPIDAFKKSGKLTNGKLMKLLLLALAQFGVIVVGILALIIGIFVAIPISYLAGAYVYRKLSPKE